MRMTKCCRCTVHFVPLTDSSNASACRGPALAFLCTVFMPAVSLDAWVMFEQDKQGYSPQQHFKVLPRGSRGIAMRYVILPASTPGSSPSSTCLENLQRNALRRQPNQIPKPLQLPSILRSRGSTQSSLRMLELRSSKDTLWVTRENTKCFISVELNQNSLRELQNEQWMDRERYQSQCFEKVFPESC